MLMRTSMISMPHWSPQLNHAPIAMGLGDGVFTAEVLGMLRAVAPIGHAQFAKDQEECPYESL